MNTTLEPCQTQQELSDLALMEQAFLGDQEAFEQIVQRYQYALSCFMRARLGNEMALDVIQFVWLQFYLTLPKLIQNQRLYHQGATIKPWLFRIALNRCIEEHRREIRHPWVLFSDLKQGDEDEYGSIVDTLQDTMPLPEEIAEQEDENEQLRIAIRSLPVKARHVVELRYRGELTFVEISHQLNISQTTAKAYFYRACEKLRHSLAAQTK